MLCTICKLKELSGKQKLYCSRLCERKAWRDNNHDKLLEGKRRYREKNKDKISLYGKAYKRDTPHIKESIALQLKAAYACLRCGSRERLEVHHLKHQRIGGGANDLNNVVVLCKPCHALWHKMFNAEYWKLA